MAVVDSHHRSGESSATARTVVIVTHAGAGDRLDRCVESVSLGGGVDAIVVVDNSATGSATFEPGASAIPIEVVRTPNRGYGAAFNRALERPDVASSRHVALLNDDVVVEPGWLDQLIEAFDGDERVGAVQPMLVLADTEPELVNSVGVDVDRFHAAGDIAFGEPVASTDDAVRSIGIFTGGAVVFSGEFLGDVGGFDERYFLYYEDVDLALRGAERGWTYRCAPAVRVRHVMGASTEALADERRRLQERNRLVVAARFASPRTVVAAWSLSVRRLRHRPRRTHLLALLTGTARAPRAIVERCRVRSPWAALLRRLRRPAVSTPAERRAPGVNVVGYHHVASGLGDIAREIHRSLDAAGVPCTAVDVHASDSPRLRDPRPTPGELYDTTIAVVAALQLPTAIHDLPDVAAAHDRLVGYWFWELDTVPESHRLAIETVDEIWTPTEFVRAAYRSAVAGGAPPVRLVPTRLDEPDVDPAAVTGWRHELVGEAHDVLFLVSLDLFSVVERKNPVGAIRAFRTAFPDGDEAVRLLVKTINGDQRPDDLQRIVAEAHDDRRITVLDRYVDEGSLHALVAAADCFVSLHRSEGLGLHLASAMWVGTPVIATRWSGNLDFMDDDCSMLVDATLVPVSDGRGAYPDSAHWAEPDLNQAASAMRRVASDPEHRALVARRARARMEAQPSRAAVGRAMWSLLGRTSHTDFDARDHDARDRDARDHVDRDDVSRDPGGRPPAPTARGIVSS